MERQSIVLVHSSMSPKVDNFAKPFKRAPTKLALKKYFRRSSVLHKNITEKPRESVIVIDSSSSSSSEGSDEEEEDDFSPIVIPDSDESLTTESEVKILPPETEVDKLEHVMQWVNNIDSENLEETNYTELSSIRASGNFPRNKGVLNSTALDPASKKFDELFKPKGKVFEERLEKSAERCSPKYVYNPSSDTSTDYEGAPKEIKDVIINDSLEEQTEKDCTKEGIHKYAFSTPFKEPEEDPHSLCENLLDSLYGDSWRSNRDHILPQSEPQKKRVQITHVKEPKTEKKPKTVFKITPYTENATEAERKTHPPKSPWREQLKNLCDSDTSEEDYSFVPSKLIFETPFNNKENKDSSNLEAPKEKIKKKLAFELPRRNALGSTDKKSFGFLASLANDVPLNQCDASARIFRSDYKRCKEELAKKLFKIFNENVFDGAISPETELEWNNLLRGTAGRCHCKRIIRRTGTVERYVRIVLSTKVLDCAERLRNTLIHEMCHAAAWVVNHVTDGHGPIWRSWTDRAIQVFPEIPQIRRCHDYEIHTKYTYKCVNCGYSFGRHTKSLNTDKKRCGYCYGKLEVFLNKITKKGEKKVVATPKKEATGWTLFVKENYGSFKTPDLKHGDVMKLLGQKFSSLKVGNAIST